MRMVEEEESRMRMREKVRRMREKLRRRRVVGGENIFLELSLPFHGLGR